VPDAEVGVTPGLIACLVALAVALAGGFAWRAGNGRMRTPRRSALQLSAVRGTEAQGTGLEGAGLQGTGPLVTEPRGTELLGTELLGTEPGGSGPSSTEPRVTDAELGQPLGARATLVQFSTSFCAPCRATRRILGEVAGMVDGVAHVEIDAESRLDLVRRLDVRRTPTVLVLGPDGRIAKRASGQPRKADVIAALGIVT
jgi:thiol-disulfide isomerase/thioredoxin